MRTGLWRRIALAGVLMAAIAGPAPAQQGQVAPSNNASADSDHDLLDTSCQQFLDILAVANPGTNPSPERAADAKAAQRDAYQAMIWVHGYISGKKGVNATTTPLSRAWLVKMVPVVANVCRKNPKAPFFTAVDTL